MTDSESDKSTFTPQPPQVEVTLADVSSVSAYVKQIYVGTDATQLDDALLSPPSQECLQKLISDPQVPLLIVDRIVTRDANPDDTGDESSSTIRISNEIMKRTERTTSVLFLKSGTIIEADKPVEDQLYIIRIPESNPYDVLLSLFGKIGAPFFKQLVKETGRGERDGDKLALSVEKNLSEVEVALLHMQQNIDIPEINLTIHPVIQSVIQQAAEQGRKAKVSDLGNNIENSVFLNALQKGVSRWVKEIQKVTKLDRDAGSGTSLQEMTFWLNLERALHKIIQKRESDEVTLTLEALRTGKRFHATVSFDADTGLKQAIAMVNDYNVLMKDLPLNELMAATDMGAIRVALTNIFAHMKKLRNTKYPIARALRFIEAISKDVYTQMLKVLGTRRLMNIPLAEFDALMAQCFAVFGTWNDEYDKLSTLMRDLSKKKREEPLKLTWRINPQHKKLEARLEQMRQFRRQHEQLRTVISRVLHPTGTENGEKAADVNGEKTASLNAGDSSAIEQVNLAYENVKEVDCLDVTNDGTAAWEAAIRRYEDQIDRVETQITARLRDQLGGAKNADEMFTIFQRFNALFVRPHIRGAIREYQTQLIHRVKEDIDQLQERFTNFSKQDNEMILSTVDIPPLSASIIWIRQIDRRLTQFMKRIEDVLGRGWENHVEGRQLKLEGDNFRQKLNTQHIFEEWVAKVQAKNISLAGRVFTIEKRQKDGRIQLKLKVNFSPDVVTLFKEVRNLKHMGFRIPLKIVNVAHQANLLYPFAISLLESVRTYDSINERIAGKEGINLLISSCKKEIQSQLSEGNTLTWESYKMDPYVVKLSETINNYQEKVEELEMVLDRIQVDLAALDTCQYSAATVKSLLTSIQKAVDQLSLGNFSNLHHWVDDIDKKIEAKLASRVEEAIRLWTMVLEHDETEDEGEEKVLLPNLQPIVLEMRVTSQVMYVSPSIEQARAHLLDQLFAWQAVVTNQSRISSTRFQLALTKDNNVESTYRDVLSRLPQGQKVLDHAYTAVEKVIKEVSEYVGEWLRYQALWDLQPDSLYERLGTDVSKWMKTLVEIRKSRSIFDTQETRKEIFPVVVDYAKVQSKVSLKYDYWHREILQKFGSSVGQEMQSFFSEISKWRAELEEQSVDSGTTSDAIQLITYVQQLKKKTKTCQEQVEQFRAAQRLLSQQRYQFPTSWLYSENIDGEWSALSDILERKDSAIQAQVSNLQTKIREEDEMVEKRTQDVLGDWDKCKPVQGAQKPGDALAALAAFEAKLNKVKEDRENMVKAKGALEMTEPLAASAHTAKLEVAVEELSDLKGVWQALTPLYNSIEEMKEKTWLSVQPRKLRQNLDELLAQLKQLPAKYRSYDSYDYAKKMMHNYSKMNMIVVELKSEALKERHWKQLMKELRVSWNLSDLTLGQVWDADLLRYESAIKQVLLVAQGELALEEFLKQVREYWQSFEVDLVNYQNKTKLIRGWDELFNKLKEHMNSLTAMKLSPYYKQFEEDAQAWEEKLNKISALFDVWIDVQRRWVYLEGLFSASADINTLLPVESGRFASISTEFLGLMKKVTAAPRILDVVNMQGAQRVLERLADMLAKIQKALGEYLERERSSFPRFYFVGDEDLLEIMGNSKDITRLQKHLKKMFAGITSIGVDEENLLVTALNSREGEHVELVKPVNIKENPRINDWLRMVENEMQSTLSHLLAQSLADFSKLDITAVQPQQFMDWLDKYPAQVIDLTANVWWCGQVERRLGEGKTVEDVSSTVDSALSLLADSVLREQPPIRRKKIEALITEFVHKRDICRSLVANKVTSVSSFHWLRCMRFYFDARHSDPRSCCTVKMANAQFPYGFEYLGIQEKLVQTPLTDRCYLTMTQALHSRLGGSPFGPAGTGKTESVKALGHKLGRFVLVFNCDETFDFQAMGRILVGLCQVGAWGCFDEFNRLEERMLSAVSQQIQTIQEAVRAGGDMKVDLVGKTLSVNSNMAIFITMNPGYSGRSNLPDNLKQLFRSLAMTQPDRQLIAQVMLFSQGFRTAERLANKIVPLFILCKEQLSDQCHYDFGLRALKYVLVSAGNIKRDEIQRIIGSGGEDVSESVLSSEVSEQQILIQSVCETLVPKLVSEDIALLFSLLSDVFPSVQYKPSQMTDLRAEIAKVCDQLLLCQSSVSGELGSAWLEKVLQLYQITNLNHGLMLVGASGSGKTTAWKVLLKALERLENVEGVAHVIDAKAMSKDALYGVLDPNTREWTDGLFTHIIRKIIDNVRGETSKRQWVIFDGDVDPEWVENLNSVLDDNKLLTLPNGERLAIPPNVRIIFEVSDLKYATLATVSRCGMVWFSKEVVTCEMLFDNFLRRLKNVRLDVDQPIDLLSMNVTSENASNTSQEGERALALQQKCALCLSQHMSADALVPLTLNYALSELDHVMEATQQRMLSSFFSMMNYAVRQLIIYDNNHSDFPMPDEQIEAYMSRAMLVNMIWAFSGDGKWKSRQQLSDFVRQSSTLPLPPNSSLPLIDYEASLSGEWVQWSTKVPQMEIETHRVAAADLVVPTVDTVRHEMLLNTWLSEHKPLVLCGPPGSGKTMTLLSALRSLQDMDVVNVNFSSSTTPELLMRTFDHYCEYRRTPNGVVLSPVQMSRWLVIFCDEINLPAPDKYGTQRVISFLRQLVEMNGFYRTSDHTWVSLERIQFVGACNPPTDPGRHPLTLRFLRHVPVVYVDYPGPTSLNQIYGTFNRAMLRMAPSIRGLAEPLTNAMVDFYLQSQDRFTQDEQPHYIYSPRELTRWVRAISEAIAPLDGVSPEALVRLWAHEALRLFQDRLVHDEERQWTDQLLDSTAEKYFGGSCNLKEALERPMLYSCWLTKNYLPVTKEQLKEYVSARLKGFYEEELDVQLVLFDQMLDHVLRIDRIYRQPQGHLLLIGTSGSGKTTLSRFVAWINGLSVFQLKVHSKYTAADFDEDMRTVLRRAGCRNEKMCFIMDESNMLDTGFLERLNTLLANGEVPGLFEGDEHTTLMSQIKEGAHRQGLMLDSPDELYKWFTAQVMRNLHVVFTMNPSGDGLRERASTSPALFNRCVLNWFGDWTDSALYQVGVELTNTLDMDRQDYHAPFGLQAVCDLLPSPVQYRHAVINTFVHVHNSVRKLNESESKRGHRVMAITPRHFLDFIKHYINVFHEKRRELEEEKLHLNIGLNKIKETEEQVLELQKSLTLKSSELEAKKAAANAKLKEMLSDQQKAEKEKVASEQLQKELAASLIEIGKKRTEVQKDLAQVEPAVEEAQQAVKGIRKTQLVEVRSMASPPHLVKLALESICLLLGENVGTDWKAIRGVMVKDDFMPRILGFDTDSITPEILKAMEKYTQNPDWDFEKVNRASSACGPMVKWVKAQLLYSDMLMKVEPLRNELKRLEKDAKAKTAKGEELKKTIAQLEQSIAAYKEEYAQLIGQAETIKADLATVKEKVGRSTQLLKSLGSERDRWHGGCDGFSQQMDSLIGDALLSAAFLAYSGYYDQQLRDVLFHRWTSFVQQAGVKYRPDLARVEYLSSVDERLEWNKNGLPVDELCAENAIMLHRFNRYPLIIDPSGQAINFLLKQFAGKNITKTSFLDDSFRKNLESALRFGNALLVQDVESYDPILNPVLNREVKRTGGRILITLGDQDIDLSPAFQIFLITRDASVEFAPDVCSRVTFVNFTVTRSSLEMQCLNQVLRSERPDVDEKRNDLLKLQGEFAVRLRQLEKALLAALNESKGKILDDDSVISTLEKLKTEAAEVARKAAETDKVMAEVEMVSQQYSRLAQACSLIYLMLQQLNEVHFLYQYSLDFLLEMFTAVLSTPQLDSVTDYDRRLQIITSSLFQMVYRRVSQGMLHQDKVLLAILLMRILLKGNSQEPSYQLEMDHLLGRSELFATQKGSSAAIPQLPNLDSQRCASLVQLQRLPAFKDVVTRVQAADDFASWIALDNAELNVPILWNDDEKLTNIGRCMNELLVVHALRPDRLLASCHRLVVAAFGVEFMQQDKVVNLRDIVENEVSSHRPVLLSSAIGYDASGKVEDLAVEMGREVTSIAIGSAEGFSQADSVLNSASKSGRWILLKNVHLAPSWLTQLEKRLHTLKPHPQFRLLLTAEIHPKLPASVLRASRVVVFEPATGLKANLLRSLSSLAPQRMTKSPAERTRLYFLMCWLHALVQERMRYTPLGWANSYEFSDADLRVACDTLDAAVDSVALGRSNVSPEKLPWHTLQTLLSQCIYGGKIDNTFDQLLLDCFLEKLFTAKSFDADRVLIPNIDGEKNLCIPDGNSREHLIMWVENIHQLQLPNWLGLPNNAEKVLLTVRGESMLANLLKVSDEELAFSSDDQKAQSPPWMSILLEQSSQWLKMLPKNIARLKRTVDNIKDPLFRFFEREVNHGIQLLSDVRSDLREVHAVCRGEQKQNNHTRSLISALNKGIVPSGWIRYTVPKGVTVMAWISDFAERVTQLNKFATSSSLKKEVVWLGGMFSPEAYITATRQLVAQSNQWSLEELNMRIEVGITEDRPDTFKIEGLRLMGAACTSGNTLKVVDEVSTELNTVALSWVRESSPATSINLPVYLYRDRKNLLFTLDFDPADVEKTVFYERSVALTSNNALS